MFKHTVTYKDYDGKERTETFYFHYNEAELMEMVNSEEGDFSARVKRLVDANEQSKVIKIVKKFVLDAFGLKSDDGRRFKKNEDIREAFEQHPAYSIIFMKMARDSKFAADFINNVVPEEYRGKIELPKAE